MAWGNYSSNKTSGNHNTSTHLNDNCSQYSHRTIREETTSIYFNKTTSYKLQWHQESNNSIQSLQFVTQRSILGLLWFLIFTNDLSKILEHSAADIYVDDTISTSADYREAPQALNQVLQVDVGKVAQWTSNNKKVPNKSKTKTMLVTSKHLLKEMYRA